MSKSRGNIRIDSERCKGCGLCIWACPIQGLGQGNEVDRRGIRVASPVEGVPCNGCGLCYVVCPDVAITVYRTGGGPEES